MPPARRYTFPILAASLLALALIFLSGDASRAQDDTPTATPTPVGVESGEIAFLTTRDGNWDIYIMAADGGYLRNLTTGRANGWWMAWSPDGSQVAFVSDRDGNAEIYVMTADGSSPRNLTIHGSDDVSPTWSPDGSQIAFVSDRDGNWEIYVMDADGSNPRNLTHNSADDWGPVWRPAPPH
jgi:TolB protein